MCSVGGKGEECITICVRPSGKYVNPVSARLASKSREGVKRFVDMQVWSTDGVEDEIDVLRKLAKDYAEVWDENYELEKELYNVNDKLKKLRRENVALREQVRVLEKAGG